MSKYHKDLTPKQIELMEKLAHHEHARWSDWQKYLHSKLEKEINMLAEPHEQITGDMIMQEKDFEQWERQIKTEYKNLSEAEKDSDREQVIRYWNLIN